MLELNDIKPLRKKLGFTQQQLARQANVSQSLIAKIESGSIDPAYSKAKRILESLELLSQKENSRAQDIMTSKLMSVTQDQLVLDVAQKMKKNNISQIPVLEGSQVIGLISEATILEAVASGKDVSKLTADDVMEASPPSVAKDASMHAVRDLLKHFPLLIVMDKGKAKGVITKADILSHLGK
ncbi:transcriptional regulator [Candidatus Woesearchaeota archaeon CG_4_10_14_0_2_um_filter_57_5]|nr:MAG: hypothetical protein AUJ68_07345 [Candidatus Woesearchaeota archaeon CG1_02_57_44]PIZ56680.1 MAG: transcriptional regulator [Candidatus Woesearchaeota archaeon CG_4_10_14_0_2_um_filter_57_5]